MEKNIKQLEGCFQEIEITLSKEELQPHYEEAYKKARPHIVLQGFRKGKVPLNMVKKIYGKQIEADANQDIISDVFGNVAKEEEWGIGQVQSNINNRITVNFENVGKKTVNPLEVELKVVNINGE